MTPSDLGNRLLQYHSGAGSVVYAVGSHLSGGHEPELGKLLDALRELDNIATETEKREDYDALQILIRMLLLYTIGMRNDTTLLPMAMQRLAVEMSRKLQRLDEDDQVDYLLREHSVEGAIKILGLIERDHDGS